MDNKVIISIVVAVILIGGIWYWWGGVGTEQTQIKTSMVEDSSNTDSGTTQADKEVVSVPIGKGRGTLGAILSGGGNYTCTFETLNSVAKSTGTVYVSGGKTRGDFATSANGITTEVHTIRTAGWNYIWVAGQNTGFKVPITTGSVFGENAMGAGFTQDENAQVTWDCHPWFTDSKQFMPPTTITFVTQ